MYNLKIYNGSEWLDADLKEGTSFAATFEEAGIAEMSLKGNGTASVSLPVTPTNARIFGQAHDPQVFAQQTRKHLPCRLYADGIELFGAGAYCVLLSTTATEYSVSVLGGSCDLFSTLQNVVFDDYPGALGTIRRYATNYRPSVNEIGARIVQAKMDATKSSAVYSMPAIPLTYIRQQLEEVTGFALPTNVFRDGYYIVLASHTRKNSADAVEPFDILTKGPGAYSNDSPSQIEDSQYFTRGSVDMPKSTTRLGMRVRIVGKNTTSSFSSQQFYFVLKVNGVQYTFGYSFSGTMQANGFKKGSYADETTGSMKVCYYRDLYFMNDGTIKDGDGAAVSGTVLRINNVPEELTSMKWGFANWTMSHDTSSGEYVFTPNYPSSCVHCEFQPLIAYGDTNATDYSEMSVGANIGFKNALDMYRALAQTFGLITHTDEHTAQAYSMASVVASKTSAVDWTDKVVSASSTFKADGYGRETHYAFTADTEYSVEAEKVIESTDENLTESVTNTIAFLAGRYWSPGFRLTNEEGEWRKLSAPYLCKWNTQLSALDFAGAGDLSEYETIEDMLAVWLKVEAVVALKPADVISIDHRRPVYLRQYGRYFYLQTLQDYIDGQTCKAVLFALP